MGTEAFLKIGRANPPAADKASEVGQRVSAENELGKQVCAEVLTDNQGHCTLQLQTWRNVTAQNELLKGVLSFIDLDGGSRVRFSMKTTCMGFLSYPSCDQKLQAISSTMD